MARPSSPALPHASRRRGSRAWCGSGCGCQRCAPCPRRPSPCRPPGGSWPRPGRGCRRRRVSQGPGPVATAAAATARRRPAPADCTAVARLAPRVAPRRALVAGAAGRPQDLGPRPAAPDQARSHVEAALVWAHRGLADRDEPDQGDPWAACGRCGGPLWHAWGLWRWGSVRDSRLEADSARLTALHMLPGHGAAARAGPDRAGRSTGRARPHGARPCRGPGGAGTGRAGAPCVRPRAWVWRSTCRRLHGPETPWCGPTACILAAERGVGTCPGGPPTATTARRAHDTGWTCVLAQRPWCGVSPARAVPGDTAPADRGGVSSSTLMQAEYDAARARAPTPGSALVRQQHPRVERQRADLVRDHDGRRRRYRGQWRVQVQSLLTGLVVHVKRLVKQLCPQGAPPAWPLV